MKYNLLQYAYIGDAIYEVLVRDYLLKSNIVKTKDLREKSLDFVSAKSQASFFYFLEDNNLLDDVELDIVRKGRNAKVHSKPKNCDILTYKYATAFEVLMGFLYEDKNYDEINRIFNEIIKMKEV